MAGASFAAGIRITRGLLAPGGMLPQEELPSHVLVAFDLWFSELALAADPFGLLVSSLLRSFSMPAAGSVQSSLMTEVEPTACDTRASSAVSFPLRAITTAAPIPIPNSTDKNAVRSSRRKRGMGDNNPNSG
jgi:hypothetical protein